MNNTTQDLQEIYRLRVLEHSKNPHHFHRPDNVDREATGFNPLCGDKISIYMQLDNEHITAAAFEGTGCAICMASASMLTDALTDCTKAEAAALLEAVQTMFKDGTTPSNARLNEFEALMGVRKYPSRIKCATLAWNTAAAALQGSATEISTENDKNV